MPFIDRTIEIHSIIQNKIEKNEYNNNNAKDYHWQGKPLYRWQCFVVPYSF
jgi:hypothetical protein